MKKNIIFTLAIIMLATLFSCGKPSGTITVTEQELSDEINQVVSQYEKQGEELTDGRLADIKQRILDQMVERKVLMALIDDTKFSIDEEKVQQEMDGIKQRYESEEAFTEALERDNFTEEKLFKEISEVMTIQGFLKKEVIDSIKISDEDIESFYNDNPQYFLNEETVTASHILIQADENSTEKQKADAKRRLSEIQEKINKGEDFVELAKNYSEGPSARLGGDLGSFGRGKMVKPFEDAAFALQPGEVSDIVETQFGYHLIKVFERADESTVPLEAASEDITNYLRSQKETEAIDEYIQKSKEYFDFDIPTIE